MTGAQLKNLRQANGLSERQFAKVLGFIADARVRDSTKSNAFKNVNPARKVRKLEEKPFVPEPIVNRINEMLANGKLVR